MKIVSWNVNGLRACIQKGFKDFFNQIDADIFCIQETKLQENQIDLNIKNYHYYINSAEKKGYSGTLIYTKNKPLNVYYGINGKYNDEGRIITLEYEKFYLINCYVPNSQEGLKRINYRMIFEDDLRNYMLSLNKPIIYCGDLNVAHNPIDLKNPKANEQNAGYSIQERTKFNELLKMGFIDSYRYLYPEKIEYSWWSYRFNARINNTGWRIDYFIISSNLKDYLSDSIIHTNIYGSDHCPIELIISI